MLKILENFDLKWWTSIGAQQKLTYGMAINIFALCWLSVMLFRANEKNHLDAEARYDKQSLQKDIEIAGYKAASEACYQSQIIIYKELYERYEKLLFETQKLKKDENNTL